MRTSRRRPTVGSGKDAGVALCHHRAKKIFTHPLRQVSLLNE